MKTFKWIWVLQAILALAFAGAGFMKVTTPKATLDADPNMAWAQEFSQGQITAIGAAEIAGAVGLIVPAATGVLPILTPIAGGALALLMSGAVATHLQRGEPPFAPLVLAVLSGLVAWLRRRG